MKFARVPGSLSRCLHVCSPSVTLATSFLGIRLEDQYYRTLCYCFAGKFTEGVMWRLYIDHTLHADVVVLYWFVVVYTDPRIFCTGHRATYLILIFSKVTYVVKLDGQM